MSTNVPDVVPNDPNTAPIEPDNGVTSDWDEQSVATNTQSLTESIMEHVYENGRRYHLKSKDQYLLPSDETEKNRLDMVHRGHLTMTKFVEDPVNVLDCGCGAGIWALVKFELDNLEKKWTFPKNHFNFIHSRHLNMSIRDWRRYLGQIFRHTAPGGCIELTEHINNRWCCDDDTMPDNSPIPMYWKALLPCYKELGMNVGLHGFDYKLLVEEVGFEDVKLYTFKIPIGPWAQNRRLKRLGTIVAETCKTGLEAYAQHAYYFEYFISARKPVPEAVFQSPSVQPEESEAPNQSEAS
ncbi:S-adenosyl-L-methionine-dependent methyltransferase [Ascodesmis nigricans]|uniref:S-adenosyl-L-methionine-dependent methyltransferase n=1 Tax=Ascodesmis nigricans TaxID=341454 RepID=A0A4V6RHC8_9PEZI|nr:S-adenosyl-L-methionine-dependent methyltransferase [Ascodesmis nigricans]